MSVRKITVEVCLYAEMPDDPDGGDRFSDELGDKIIAAVQNLDGVIEDSVSISDWTDVGSDGR